jgi:hypothetical protein
MLKKLGDGDGHAIDLVLDRGSFIPGQAVYVPPNGDGLEKRVKSVENILKLLAHMPAPEPSADLVARTLQRVWQDHPAVQPTPGALHPAQGQPRHPA